MTLTGDYIPEGFEPLAGARPGTRENNVAAFPAARRVVRVITGADFAGRRAPSRYYHVNPLVPGHTVTMLGGDGGTGKSLLALQLAVATVTSGTWCGLPVQQGACLYLSAEDDESELHRRLEDIAEHEQVRMEDLARLRIVPLAGEDAVMAAPQGGSNILKASPLFSAIEALLVQHVPSLVVLDTLADLFGGAENERAQARQFIGMLRGWAIRYNTAILLLSHPSLSGMSSGTGSSGSTAWNNSVRSRLYLDRVKAEDGFEADPDARVLRTVKANYGRTGAELRLRWQSGTFVTVGENVPTSAVGAMAEEARVDRVFFDLLSCLAAEGRHVSPNRNAPTFAPAMFGRDPRAEGINKRGFDAAMARLFAAGRIKVGHSDGPPSKRREIIVEVAVGGRSE